MSNEPINNNDKEIDDAMKTFASIFTSPIKKQSTGSCGIRASGATIFGKTSSSNGHYHVYAIKVDHNSMITGMTRDLSNPTEGGDSTHSHQIIGDLRSPQLQAADDSNGCLHSHVVAIPNDATFYSAGEAIVIPQ